MNEHNSLTENINTLLEKDNYKTTNFSNFIFKLVSVINEYFTYEDYKNELHMAEIDANYGIRKKSKLFLIEINKYFNNSRENYMMLKSEIDLQNRIKFIEILYQNILDCLGNNFNNFFSYLFHVQVTFNSTIFNNIIEYFAVDMAKNHRCLNIVTLLFMLQYNTSLDSIYIYNMVDRIMFTFINQIQFTTDPNKIDLLINKLSASLDDFIKFSKIDINELINSIKKELDFILTEELKKINAFDGNFRSMDLYPYQNGTYNILLFRRLIAIQIYAKICIKYLNKEQFNEISIFGCNTVAQQNIIKTIKDYHDKFAINTNERTYLFEQLSNIELLPLRTSYSNLSIS